MLFFGTRITSTVATCPVRALRTSSCTVELTMSDPTIAAVSVSCVTGRPSTSRISSCFSWCAAPHALRQCRPSHCTRVGVYQVLRQLCWPARHDLENARKLRTRQRVAHAWADGTEALTRSTLVPYTLIPTVVWARETFATIDFVGWE
eukprot:2884768-Rhodomonas_salina.1